MNDDTSVAHEPSADLDSSGLAPARAAKNPPRNRQGTQVRS